MNNNFHIPGIPVLAFLVFGATVLTAQGDRVISVSSQKARALALGGAVTAVEDDLAALSFNPAAFSVKDNSRPVNIHMVLNPFAPAILFSTAGGGDSWLGVAGALLQGVTVSAGRLSFGLVFYEEGFIDAPDPDSGIFFNGRDMFRKGSTVAGASLSLAPHVSFGAAAELSRQETPGDAVYGLGYQYGVYIRMRSSLSIGLSFSNLPDNLSKQRLPLERYSDEALNIGFSYNPWDFLLMSLDIRNVSDQGSAAVREPHAGLEFSPVDKLSLRCGYYNENNRTSCISFGAGLNYNGNAGPLTLRSIFDRVRIDTAVIWKKQHNVTDRWLVLTTNITL